MNFIKLFLYVAVIFSFTGCASLITRGDLNHCQSHCESAGHKLDRVLKIQGEACCICK